MPTYKPLTTGQVATQGTSGAAVKTLQEQLNATNAGKPGYTPLKVDSLYGPLTAAAAAYKAPAATTSTTPAPTADRFARTANSNDAAIKAAQDKLAGSQQQEPDMAAITKQNRANSQGLIDQITQEFNRVIGEQNIVGQGFNDRVRALNTSGGLQGSDFGTAAAVGQETKNKKAIDMINQEKEAKIGAILAGVADRSSEQYRQQRQEYVKGLENNLDALKQAREEDKARALDTVKNLAQQGVALDKMKEVDPESYKTLLDEYGGSAIDLESQWNEALPEDQKVKYQDKIIQGPNGTAQLFRYGVNPRTGTVDQKEYDLGVDFNKLNGVKPVNVNGRLFALSTDAQGNEIARPLTDKTVTGGGTSSGKSLKTGNVTFSGDQLSSVEKELQNSKTLYGGDGKYVNPQVYEQAYQAWTEEGGLTKDFLTQFPPAKYVNPANNQLPEYLRSGMKTSPTAPKSSSGRSI